MKEQGERIRVDHVLRRSKLVAMGVAVTNLAVGGVMKMHTDRASFDKAMRDEGVEPLRSE